MLLQASHFLVKSYALIDCISFCQFFSFNLILILPQLMVK